MFWYWGKVDAFWWALNIESQCLLELSSAEMDFFSTWSAAALSEVPRSHLKWLVRGGYSQSAPWFLFLINNLLACFPYGTQRLIMCMLFVCAVCPEQIGGTKSFTATKTGMFADWLGWVRGLMSPRGLAFSVSVSHAGDISVLTMLNRCFAGPYPPKILPCVLAGSALWFDVIYSVRKGYCWWWCLVWLFPMI